MEGEAGPEDDLQVAVGLAKEHLDWAMSCPGSQTYHYFEEAQARMGELQSLSSWLKSAQDKVDMLRACSVDRAVAQLQEQKAKAVADKAGTNKQLREQEAAVDTLWLQSVSGYVSKEWLAALAAVLVA